MTENISTRTTRLAMNTDIKLVHCQCGFEAEKICYTGGKNGKWMTRCSRSTCPIMVSGNNAKEVAEKWNKKQHSETDVDIFDTMYKEVFVNMYKEIYNISRDEAVKLYYEKNKEIK